MQFFLSTGCPIANDIASIEIFYRSVLLAKPASYDSDVLDAPWREVPPPKQKLRFGLVGEDPSFPLHPPVKRAVASAAKLLQDAGHEIVPIPASRARLAEAISIAWSFFLLDSTAVSHIEASGEPIIPSIQVIKDALGVFMSDPKRHNCHDTDVLEGVPKVAALNVKRREFAEEWRKILTEERLDAVIGPPNQGTAGKHDLYGLPPYTVFLNVLNVSILDTHLA